MQRINENSMFVKLDEYKDVMRILDDMKKTVQEAQTALEKANAIRNEEDAEVDLWHKSIADIQRRIQAVDKALFDAGNRT